MRQCVRRDVGPESCLNRLQDDDLCGMLLQADSAEMVAQRAGGGVSAAANTAAAASAARTQDLALLRRPRVFTVAIVWESAQVLRQLVSVPSTAYASHAAFLSCKLLKTKLPSMEGKRLVPPCRVSGVSSLLAGWQPHTCLGHAFFA